MQRKELGNVESDEVLNVAVSMQAGLCPRVRKMALAINVVRMSVSLAPLSAEGLERSGSKTAAKPWLLRTRSAAKSCPGCGRNHAWIWAFVDVQLLPSV